ncbi:hypothetical protein Z968_06490 [Clostridium novyi A str. 4552]|uniref:Uncharacterized protein n=1 Tax=Clostridium novyi A str. 4552 TaxID=1444289 RepID=A0A0A0I4X2_CLONO|nr:hypothetical protein [Clostridium novyi]KGM96449.1 hypothetical protein Z968_06490 [Clostridium novyi A str. 4552]
MKKRRILNYNNLCNSVVDQGELQILNRFGRLSKVPIISCLDNYCIKYLEYSREIQFLYNGIYKIYFQLLINSANECDKVCVNIGEKRVYELNVPIRKETKIEGTFKINIEDTDDKLSITNISDDKLILQCYKGGYNMESSVMSVTREGQPIEINAIKSINNKTITVVLNQNFTDIDTIEVYKISDGTQVQTYYVQDSINPLENEMVVVADNTFETGISYMVKVTRNNETAQKEFIVQKTAPPVNTSVEVVGNRILNVEFDMPIKNLNDISSGESDETLNNILTNFYMLYYNQDFNGELDGNINKWYGIIRADTGDNTQETTVRIAKDYKSMEIQYNNISMPLGTHGFIVGFSKMQLLLGSLNKQLMDFSDDQNIFPTTRKIINIQKDNIVAKPISVKSKDRTTVIVTFDKPVIMLESEKNAISVSGNNISVSKVSRLGNKFDTLKYELETPLPIGSANITIGRITDANGYKTEEALFKDVPVIVVPPRIVDVYQHQDKQDEIVVKFSKDMKNTSGDGGVTNTSYYSISKLNGILIKPIQAYNYNSDEYTVNLKLGEKLDAGSHTLYASSIQDKYGTPMEAQSVVFNIVDTTKPNVESITFREKAIVIKFDEIMQTVGEHSITEVANYRLQQLDNGVASMKSLPVGTTFLTMNDNKWVRITVPEDILSLNLPINIGYQGLKEIKYITNISGNILEICPERKLQQLIEAIDISSSNLGTLTVIDNSKLQYKYLGNNEFYSVNKEDFQVFLNDKLLTIVDISFGYKTIDFNFAPNTFDGGSTNIKLKTAATVNYTKDIFGYTIEANKQYSGTVVNGMKAKIKSVSLINSNKLRMVFNKDIKVFNPSDFRCIDGAESVLGISGTHYSQDPGNKIFDLTLQSSVSFADNLKLALAVPKDMIQTEDIDGNKIEVFDYIEVSKLFARAVKWVRGNNVDNSIGNNKVIVEFTLPINPKTLINSINQTGAAWDGNDASIDAGNIEFNSNLMTIKGNGNYGTIKLEGLNVSPEVTNKQSVTLTLSQNKEIVTLIFDSSEDIQIGIQSVTEIMYNPSNNICDASNEVYLYEDFKPVSAPSNV